MPFRLGAESIGRMRLTFLLSRASPCSHRFLKVTAVQINIEIMRAFVRRWRTDTTASSKWSLTQFVA